MKMREYQITLVLPETIDEMIEMYGKETIESLIVGSAEDEARRMTMEFIMEQEKTREVKGDKD